ncbi:succinyl-diaminopimelate desuccinylase [Aquipuribacter hungaricus]|uniref:Succinyl-diaminopimelate desuccinylase n=1 Tax=Aquipuribacter hungaricus TaxID=545624 RepID=A0ABV7WAE8_9MICO
MTSSSFFPPAALPLPDPVALTRALVDIPSVSGDEGAVADAVEALLRAQAHLEVVRDGDAVLARTSLDRPERVLVAGHIDTVPVADNVPGRLEAPGEGDDPDGGDVLWGRGTTDMKGGVAMALVAACTVPEPVRDVTYVFYDCEEVESERNGLGRLARTLPGWLAADLAVLGEPTGGLVEGGCQGTLRVDVTVRGRTAHSARAWRGVNAIHAVGDVLARLQAYEPRRPVVDGLEYHEGLQAVGIRGGIAGNMVPDVCTVHVNHRFAPDRSSAEAFAHVQEVFAGLDVELELLDVAEGARPGLDLPAARAFVEAVGPVAGGAPRAKLGWTDVARFSALGVPAVNFGPGDPQLAHADDERVPVAQLVACTEGLVAWLRG